MAKPVESRNGDDITGLDAKLEKPAGQARNSFDELHSGFPAAVIDGHGGVAADGGETAQALADVGLRVRSHQCRERLKEIWREWQRTDAIYTFFFILLCYMP